MNKDFFRSQVRGGMLGLVTGDALGVPVEFLPRRTLDRTPVRGMLGHGTHNQPAGTWSDDSSMALCTLECLCGRPDPEALMGLFLAWADDGVWTAGGTVFDMGMATRRALDRFAGGSRALDCGGSDFHDNGNGSLMRILPAALRLYRDFGPRFSQQPQCYEFIHRLSSLTHAHPISLVGCGIYCAVACQLLAGTGDRISAVRQGIRRAKGYYCSHPDFSWVLSTFHRVDADLLLRLPREDIESSGYVVHTLEAALWCLLHTQDYPSCVLTAVNLGDDTDTVAAVAGGLAGLCWGPQAIPEEWLAVLARREDIVALCDAFCP